MNGLRPFVAGIDTERLRAFSTLECMEPYIYCAIYYDIDVRKQRGLAVDGREDYFSTTQVLTKVRYMELVEGGFIE